MFKERVYWHETVEMPSDGDPAPLPGKVDIAVVGGGYTGLSAALTLAKRGVSVAVLEAQAPGWGASSRNGGMTLTGLKVGLPQVIKDYGKQAALDMFRTSLDAIDTVERIIKEENINCGFARTGHLQVITKASQVDSLAASVDFMQKEFNHKTRLLSKAELSSEVGSPVYFGGVLDEVSGGLNPAQYAAGLAHAAQKAGAVICSRAAVSKLERNPAGFTLTTTRGTLEARQVLVATSGYTGAFFPWVQHRIIPIGSFIIATAPLSGELASSVIPGKRMIFDSRHYLNYYRLSEDNRMIFGGRAAFFPETSSTIRRSAQILHEELLHTFPQLRDVQVEFAWGGTLDFPFDMMPHTGEQNGVFYSIGYAGHGVALATHLGQTTAEGMLDGGIERLPFSAIPFPGAPLGLYNGKPWFLPFAGLWYRILDLVE